MSNPVILYVGLWANPPYDCLSERFAHMQDDCARAGCSLRVWHWDHPSTYSHDQAAPAGVILSGSCFDLPCATDSSRPYRPLHDYRPLMQQLFLWRVPVLGICFGHQLMALDQGCDLTVLPSKRREGNHPIAVVHDDPILGPAGSRLQVPENHQMVVRTVDSQRWQVVAESSDGIEAMRHRQLPWLGVQFHPEYHPESDHDDALRVFDQWLCQVRDQPAEVVVR